jgi:hypothetical protein
LIAAMTLSVLSEPADELAEKHRWYMSRVTTTMSNVVHLLNARYAYS